MQEYVFGMEKWWLNDYFWVSKSKAKSVILIIMRNNNNNTAQKWDEAEMRDGKTVCV